MTYVWYDDGIGETMAIATYSRDTEGRIIWRARVPGRRPVDFTADPTTARDKLRALALQCFAQEDHPE